MKYLHLVNDEKFIDFVIDQFETCNPGNNIFLVGVTDLDAPLKHIKQRSRVQLQQIDSAWFIKLINELEYDVLVVHYLDDYKVNLINSLTKKVQILWLSWGGDIYNSKFFHGRMYQPLTHRALFNIGGFKDKAVLLFGGLIAWLLQQKTASRNFRSAVAKVDFCATVIPDEFKLLQRWPFFKARQVRFAYGSVEDQIKDDTFLTDGNRRNDILIGNSSFPTSNHLDAFHAIEGLVAKGQKVVVPLNYGTEGAYREIVLSCGSQLFHENFEPLLSFMPKQDYVKILQRCGIAIMNHERQQGVGNLIILLWLGAKIFFSADNVTYQYFKARGFKVYPLNQKLNADMLSTPLSMEEAQVNRDMLMEEYGHDNVLARTARLLTEIENSCH